MTEPFLLEPDIIEANENILPYIANDLILAKNYLKTQSAATGDSLYDHLVDIIHKVLTQKPSGIVDTFEQYSWEVKEEKFRPNFDHLKDVYLGPDMLQFIKRLDKMFNVIYSKLPKAIMGEEEEPELDFEEELERPKVPDLIETNNFFRQAGFGLPDNECYNVYMALKYLATSKPVSTVRLFGKIYGTENNYYIAETDLTMEELDRRVMEFDMKDMPGENAEEEKPFVADAQETLALEQEMAGEGEMPELPKERVPPPIPPAPVSTWKELPPVPVERPGQGLNRKFKYFRYGKFYTAYSGETGHPQCHVLRRGPREMTECSIVKPNVRGGIDRKMNMVYWVCNFPGEDWVCLPDVTPQQIDVARKIVRCMTGHLNAELHTYPPFDGLEMEYLRAQIARIAASTSVSPQGFYTFGSGEEEEDLDMEEGDMGNMDFNENHYYSGHTLKDLTDSNLNSWVHHGRYILKQGRTIWWNPAGELDEEMGEEEEDDEVPKPVPESGPSLMTPLSEDARAAGIPAWTARPSSTMSPDRAIAILRSNIWPGAYAFSTTGKNCGCMYVGWGHKYEPHNYSPPPLPPIWTEYPLGPEIMEMSDPTFADEEAYRIAHLPPVPPPELPGEGGEGDFGEEEEDEDEE